MKELLRQYEALKNYQHPWDSNLIYHMINYYKKKIFEQKANAKINIIKQK